jgi:hypothetical protein
MKQFVLDYLTRESSKSGGLRAYKPHSHDSDLYIELKDGRTIAVYVVNYALRLPEIREKCERNSALQLHTLFVVDQRILPPHNVEAPVAYWMAALHALSDGRIYAYHCDRRKVQILPLHIAWKWGNAPRLFQYGPAVKVAQLRADVCDCSTKYIEGSFAVADFGDDPFWKKRSAINDAASHKYSWRNFSFNSSKKRSAPPPDEETYWDGWEDFERSYGDMGGQSSGSDWTHGERQRSGARPRTQIVIATHYATLGVNLGASLEEVKRAYRRKARENHPDMHPHDKQEYTMKMAEINAAFDAIRKHLEE